MPFYEYECANCKFYMEVMQKITDAPLTKCPSCGKTALKKLVSAPVFRLKGGGWYETDFKSDSEARRNLAAADKPEKAEDSKAPAGADAKPAEAKPKEPAAASAEATKAPPAKAARSGRKSASPPRRASKPKPKSRARKSRR